MMASQPWSEHPAAAAPDRVRVVTGWWIAAVLIVAQSVLLAVLAFR